jgi:hypothetical protein
MEREDEKELLSKLSRNMKIIEGNAYFQSKKDLLLNLERRNIVKLSKTEEGGKILIISCILTEHGEDYKQKIGL